MRHRTRPGSVLRDPLPGYTSHSIDSAQFSSLATLCSGDHDIFRAASMIVGGIFTNHWRSEDLVRVLQPAGPTRCSVLPAVSRILLSPYPGGWLPAGSRRHPHVGPAIAVRRLSGRWPCGVQVVLLHTSRRPSCPRTYRIITAPLPNSGSTATSSMIGTWCPKMGTTSLFPFMPR